MMCGEGIYIVYLTSALFKSSIYSSAYEERHTQLTLSLLLIHSMRCKITLENDLPLTSFRENSSYLETSFKFNHFSVG